MHWLVAVFFLISGELQAQQILPLFQNDSLRTYVTMPFRLRRSTNESIPIVGIKLVNAAEDCKAMIDPNILSNFLLRCQAPVSVSVDVFFEFNGTMQKIRYGPLNVTQISDSGEVVQPPTDTDRYRTGRELFAAKCMSCHQSPYDKQNVSLTRIKDSIQTVQKMNHLSTLTEAQLEAIRDYLNHLD